MSPLAHHVNPGSSAWPPSKDHRTTLRIGKTIPPSVAQNRRASQIDRLERVADCGIIAARRTNTAHLSSTMTPAIELSTRAGSIPCRCGNMGAGWRPSMTGPLLGGAFACLMLLAVASVPSSAATDRVALVIGNGAYRHANPLPNPPNDAADVAAALRAIGFDVVEGRDLDKRAMEAKIIEFGRKLDGASLAAFFYAGHGLQVGGKNYLVPIDAKVERAAELGFETIKVNQVLAQMEAVKAENLVFLDACRNSPFTAALLRHMATPGLEVSSLMKRVRPDVVQATNQKQVPWDHSSLMGDVVLVPGVATPNVVAPAKPPPPSTPPQVALHSDPEQRPARPRSATESCANLNGTLGVDRYCASSILSAQFGNSYGVQHLF